MWMFGFDVNATCVIGLLYQVEEHFCDAQKLASCLGLDSFEEMLEMEVCPSG